MDNIDIKNYSIDDEYINEGTFKDEPDIYYNKKAFDNGDINLCFITGLSGSGKSTMGADIQKKGIAIHTDLDLVFFQFDKSDEFINNYNEVYKSFFTGQGKKWHQIPKEECLKDPHKYAKDLIRDFVKFTEKYAASHKNQKFVLDGTWIFAYIYPNEIKDYAVYIKGTSAVKSMMRRFKRDISGRKDLNLASKIGRGTKMIKNYVLNLSANESAVDKYRAYFNKLQEEQSKGIKHEESYYADPDYGIITEMSFTEFMDQMNKWKTTDQSKNKKTFKSTAISDKDFENIESLVHTLRTADDYKEYKSAFDKFCRIIHIVSRGVIICKIKLKKGKEDMNTLEVEYSFNVCKIKIPKGSALYHITKVPGITELVPQFRGKSERGYLYDKPRVYFTLRKHMNKLNADYNIFSGKMHTYICKQDIKEAYVDPLLWSYIKGAIYVESNKPIPVEDIKNNESVDESFIDILAEMGIEPVEEEEVVNEGLGDLLGFIKRERSKKVKRNVDNHKASHTNSKQISTEDKGTNHSLLKEAHELIENRLKLIVNKYNSDSEIKQSIREDIDDYVDKYKNTYDENYLHEVLCGFEKSGVPKFECKKFDEHIYDNYGELVILLSDYTQDLNLIMLDYMDEIAGDLEEDPEIKKYKVISSINYGDGDEGCIYITTKPKRPEPKQESVQDMIIGRLMD